MKLDWAEVCEHVRADARPASHLEVSVLVTSAAPWAQPDPAGQEAPLHAVCATWVDAQSCVLSIQMTTLLSVFSQPSDSPCTENPAELMTGLVTQWGTSVSATGQSLVARTFLFPQHPWESGLSVDSPSLGSVQAEELPSVRALLSRSSKHAGSDHSRGVRGRALSGLMEEMQPLGLPARVSSLGRQWILGGAPPVLVAILKSSFLPFALYLVPRQTSEKELWAGEDHKRQQKEYLKSGYLSCNWKDEKVSICKRP